MEDNSPFESPYQSPSSSNAQSPDTSPRSSLPPIDLLTMSPNNHTSENSNSNGNGSLNLSSVVPPRFLEHFCLERHLTPMELKLLSLTFQSAKRHGFDNLLAYLSGIPEEVLRRQVKLKQETRHVGIPSSEFFSWISLLNYCMKVSRHQCQTADQINDFLIAGNTIQLRVEDLFNGGELLSKNGVRLNGIFGKQEIVKREDDLKDIDDLMPFLYILNHSLTSNSPLPVYFLFFGETPNPVVGIGVHSTPVSHSHHPKTNLDSLDRYSERYSFSKMRTSSMANFGGMSGSGSLNSSGSSNNVFVTGIDGVERSEKDKIFLEYNSGPWYNANLVLERCQKFMDEAIGMSLDIVLPTSTIPGGVIVVDSDNKAHMIPILCCIYDLNTMTLWRVERVDTDIFAERMDQWLVKYLNYNIYPNVPLFSRKEVIEKHIERLRSHSSHGSEHLQLRHSTTKKVGCVDGRQDNNESEIGAYISFAQFFNILTDNHTSRVIIAYHQSCGYLRTAIQLHKIFRALREAISPLDHITRGRTQLFIKTLMTKPWLNRHEKLFTEIMSHVDANKISEIPAQQEHIKKMFHNFITDTQGTLRYATSHMMDRGLFVWQNGYPVMRAASLVEDALKKNELDYLSDKTEPLFFLLVTEEALRLDEAGKTEWIGEHAERISAKRLDHKIPCVEYYMEDFHSGRYYKVPDKPISYQSKEEILSSIRQDVRSGVNFDVNEAGPGSCCHKPTTPAKH
eukprot:TRINITY_DN7345_c0_g1_i1.p1 TRINITY_DN7345_c0_g1~~TRINITY_DN7345_c0_g1_i1.p1  ORF type:complete len:735 (-),score=142.01 TRINITY_DN7345_c0_g1_i1:112-2316(-)